MFHELTNAEQKALILHVKSKAVWDYEDCIANGYTVDYMSLATPTVGSILVWPILTVDDITNETIETALRNLEPGDCLYMSVRRDPFYVAPLESTNV
jgi:hypothetical protein